MPFGDISPRMKHVPATPGQVVAAMALISLVMAMLELMQQRSARPDGRWSFLFAPIWDAFGWKGLVGYWVLLAVMFGGVLFFLRKRK